MFNIVSIIFNIIWTLQMPLFFIISGYLYNPKEKFLKFTKNKFLRIMIPYLIWAILYLVPYYIFSTSIISNLNINAIKDIGKLILNTLYGTGYNFMLRQNSALWFLPALFTMEILFYYLIKLSKSKKNDLIMLITILVINIISSTWL